MRQIIPTFLIALGTVALSGTAVAQDKATSELLIQVDDQQPKAKTITVSKVTLPRDGFVVIHAVRDGKPVAPGSVGHKAVAAGTHENLEVELDSKPDADGEYIAMLHEDTGTEGEYEFGPGSTDVDKPIMKDGKPVTDGFKLSVPEKM